MSGFEEGEEEDGGGGGGGRPCLFDNDESRADTGTEEGGIEDAGRDTDRAAGIEVGTGGRAVVAIVVVVVVVVEE